MRTGACSVQQALTTEAALVLKHSLCLARRRGHAQVTPLHVAATLLSSSYSSSPSSTNILKRACFKSQSHQPTSHPLQCRALELCFNVALNRLPTTTPSCPLTPPNPSLSNALIAALKRAQAHQRRGSIEPPQQFQQQQQQQLLAVKVELEQLIVSILDDPSVSRVMKEAGFSSTQIKKYIEENLDFFIAGSTAAAAAAPAGYLFESHREVFNKASTFFHSHFLKLSPDRNPLFSSSHKDDLKVVVGVMLKNKGRRSNVVVVGDSTSYAEVVIAELMRKVETRDVPEELQSAIILRFQIPMSQLRLMSKSEIGMKISELRKRIETSGSQAVILYVGDLKWIVEQDIIPWDASRRDICGFNPIEKLITDLGRVVADQKSSSIVSNNGVVNQNPRLWLMASSSYQTYMKCQMRKPSLETQWSLNAVVVPAGGLALSLQLSGGIESTARFTHYYPFEPPESKSASLRDEQEDLFCCNECICNFEKEASFVTWLQPQNSPKNHHTKTSLLEMRRKWSTLCQSLHLKQNQHKAIESSSDASPPAVFSPNDNGGIPSFLDEIRNRMKNSSPKMNSASWSSELKLSNYSASSREPRCGKKEEEGCGLRRRLQENIPWQSETIPSIMEALFQSQLSKKKNGLFFFIRGNDRVGKLRLARVLSEWLCGADGGFVSLSGNICSEMVGESIDLLMETLEREPRSLVLIDNVDRACKEIINLLLGSAKNGFLEHTIGRKLDIAQTIFILTTGDVKQSSNHVINMRLCTGSPPSQHKRKANSRTKSNSKTRRRINKTFDLDLNLCAEEEEFDVPQSVVDGDVLESISHALRMDSSSTHEFALTERLQTMLEKSFHETGGGMFFTAADFSVDRAALEALAGEAGTFMEETFDKWLTQVFQTTIQTLNNGRKVSLCLDDNEEEDNMITEDVGFHGSILPSRIRVG